MIEFVREFTVEEGAKGHFELVFGPGGAWSTLFSSSPGFRGTTVMRDVGNPVRYLIVDLWDSETDREDALANDPAEYSELEAALDKLTVSKTDMGTFNVLAQATVRPSRKAGQSDTGRKGRKSR